MPTGNISLYLDIYRNGKREYEYLKLYLVPEKTRADKEKNRETLKFAEAVKAKRIVELQNKEFGFKNDYAEETKFFDYYRKMCEDRLGIDTKGNWGNWQSCLKHLEAYEKDKEITFSEITTKWVQGFRDYLNKDADAWGRDVRARKTKPLSQNSKVSYFNKLRACLNQAFEERIISRNPAIGVEGFKAQEGTRMYLTMEELRMLAQTECSYTNIRRAFLFSCLTGLRRSDIIKLTWGDVQQQGEFTRLIFKQKKTKAQEYLDITPQAEELMGERKADTESVFGHIYDPTTTNNVIKMWVFRAGINKEITFHVARHYKSSYQLKINKLQDCNFKQVTI